MPDQIFDIVIVGGGPAGLLAAGLCGQLRLPDGSAPSVLLLEKNERPGRKLLLTGNGTCNISNIGFQAALASGNEPMALTEAREMAACYQIFTDEQMDGDSLESARPARELITLFSRFPPSLVARLLGPEGLLGIELEERENGRLFPKSGSAREVRDCLVEYARQGGAIIRCGTAADSLMHASGRHTDNPELVGVKTTQGATIHGKRFILATGGISYPITGSTGDAFPWLTDLGLAILPAWPALVPILTREKWVADLAGLGLPKTTVSLYLETVKGDAQGAGMIQVGKPRQGPLMFTHRGLSGPVILHLSAWLLRLAQFVLESGNADRRITLKIDLLPDSSQGALVQDLDRSSREHPHQLVRTWVAAHLTQACAEVVCAKILSLPTDTVLGHFPRKDRLTLIDQLKGLTLHYAGHEGLAVAMGSAGGLSPQELDWKTMVCKRVPNLHILGDLVALDRRSGGYSLLLCWASAMAAARGCADALKAQGLSEWLGASK